MKSVTLTLKTKTPLAIATRNNHHRYLACLDWVPATTLRGALAAEARKSRSNGLSESDKAQLFGANGVRFCDLFPPSYHCPERSLVGCSVKPGRPPHGHYEMDCLSYLMGKAINRSGALPAVDCPVCGAPVGYSPFLKDCDGRRLLSAKTIIKRKRQIVGNPRVTDPGICLEALPAGAEFRGSLETPDELFDSFVAFLSSVSDLSIGSDRSLGLGKVELSVVGENTQLAPLAMRLGRFNERLSKALDPLPAGLTAFSIVLHTDMMLLDDLLRSRTTLALTDLSGSEAAPEWLKAFRMVGAFSAIDYLRSYNTHPAVQMMRAPEQMIARGSVFLFANTTTDGDPAPFDRKQYGGELEQFLTQAEGRSIGEMTQLGFGKIYVCSQDRIPQEQPGLATETEPRSVASPEEA